MKVIQICPDCGVPAIKVNRKAVINNLNVSEKNINDKSLKWNICVNPTCDSTYFSEKYAFTVADIPNPLYFKNDSDDAMICYCSELTRGEIKNAVRKGCKTIRDVHNFTRKKKTGHCDERNSLGKCCRHVFLKTLKDELKK